MCGYGWNEIHINSDLGIRGWASGSDVKFLTLSEHTLTVGGDFIKGHVVLLRHVAQEGEDDEAGEEAGQ